MPHISLTEFQRQRLKPIFEHIERACREEEIGFYLVGAVARDFSMTIHGLQSTRVTKDLDLAVLVPDEAAYLRLKNNLLAQGDFAPVQNIPFTLKFAGQTDVDLMPFGGLELDGQVHLNRGEGVAELSVTGFAEVFEHGTYPATLDNTFTFRVCGLPGMVLLKLIAYDDRPEQRLKDLSDIGFILKNYLDITGDELYDTHYDLLDDFTDINLPAARILGRDMRPLMESSPKLRQRIVTILDSALMDGFDGNVIKQIHRSQYQTQSLEHVYQLLHQIRQGLDDSKPVQ